MSAPRQIPQRNLPLFPTPGPRHGDSRLRLLVVEDDADQRELSPDPRDYVTWLTSAAGQRPSLGSCRDSPDPLSTIASPDCDGMEMIEAVATGVTPSSW